MSTICTICARGGSMGVPRKNTRPLLGKPLVAWTVEQALEVQAIDHVFVSTDDDEIAEIARAAGAVTPFRRPAELATSEAGKLPVIEHLVAAVESDGVVVDRIVDLDPTSPLRSISDIEGALAMLDDDVDVVITGYRSDKNPYFNMVEQKADGRFGLVVHSDAVSRQAAKPVWAMNGSVYVWHRGTLELGLWGGRVRMFEMPHDRSVDIDSEVDFALVELLMTRRTAAARGTDEHRP